MCACIDYTVDVATDEKHEGKGKTEGKSNKSEDVTGEGDKGKTSEKDDKNKKEHRRQRRLRREK